MANNHLFQEKDPKILSWDIHAKKAQNRIDPIILTSLLLQDMYYTQYIIKSRESDFYLVYASPITSS